MVFPQILNHMPVVIEICKLPPAPSVTITFWGVVGWKMGAIDTFYIFYSGLASNIILVPVLHFSALLISLLLISTTSTA